MNNNLETRSIDPKHKIRSVKRRVIHSSHINSLKNWKLHFQTIFTLIKWLMEKV